MRKEFAGNPHLPYADWSKRRSKPTRALVPLYTAALMDGQTRTDVLGGVAHMVDRDNSTFTLSSVEAPSLSRRRLSLRRYDARTVFWALYSYAQWANFSYPLPVKIETSAIA